MTKWHRQKFPALNQTVSTERFDLVKMNGWQVFKAFRRTAIDDDLRGSVFRYMKRPSLIKTYAMMRKATNKSSHTFAIQIRETGELLGWHSFKLRPYKTAVLTIVLFNRERELSGVGVEVRRALIRHLARHAGVENFSGFTNVRNFSSVQLYQKLGFKRVGTHSHVDFDHETDRIMSSFYFELNGEALDRFVEENDT